MSKIPTYKTIFRLAIPAIFGGIVEPILSLTDIAVVGNIPSNNPNLTITSLAAVGLAGSLISALLWIFAQVKSAISALVSKAVGANNINSVATLIPQMILFNLGLGILAFLLTYFSSSWIFTSLLSASNAVAEQAVAYYDIRAFGFPITLITFSLFGVFRGLQNTYWAMIISIVGGCLNILLDFILVLGLGDFCEPMGIEGAAIASLIAQIVMFLLAIFFLLRSKVKLLFSNRINQQFKVMVHMAVHLMVRTITLNIALVLTHKFANKYGEIEAATHTVLLNIWLFSAFFLDGFATAANALSGKYLGQQNPTALKETLKKNMLLAFLVALLLIVIFLLFHVEIIGVLAEDSRVTHLYKDVLFLFILCLPLNALAFTLDGVFKGLGEAKFLRNLLVISTLFGFLPVLFIADYFSVGLQVIWLALIVWIFLRGLIPLIYFKTYLKRKFD